MSAAEQLARLLAEHGRGVVPTDHECRVVRSGRRPGSADRLLVAGAVDAVVRGCPSWHSRVLLLDAFGDWLVEVSTGVEVA